MTHALGRHACSTRRHAPSWPASPYWRPIAATATRSTHTHRAPAAATAPHRPELTVLDRLAEAYGKAWLRAKSDRGSEVAAAKLTELLADGCTLDELRAEVDAGTLHTAARYLECLARGSPAERDNAARLAMCGLTDTGEKWW